MLDPAERKCSNCFDDQRKYGVPIPNCENPDGDGKKCQFPKIQSELFGPNMVAWSMWTQWSDQLIVIEPTMAGCFYTLNSDFLIWLMNESGEKDKVTMFKKMRTLFNVWREIQERKEQTKTEAAMNRTTMLRRENG